jgi:chromosomal replication initiator protein
MQSMDHRRLWQETSRKLKQILTPENYDRWFAALEPISLEDNVLTLGVANNLKQIWLEDNYASLLSEIVEKKYGKKIQVSFKSLSKPEEELAQVVQPKLVAPRKKSADKVEDESGLSPRNVFDNFVVGSNNEFAHAAARAVAQSPARAYNPLFIYGGVGLGKTHLMQAIGHYVHQQNKDAKVAYVSSEKFLNEFIDAIQNKNYVRFRKKYRQCDILLIDDIHFLAGKEQIQEEFFHTFNTLFDAQKQIILSSDRPVTEISNLQSRLVSRFEWGLVTQLEPPDLETRIAILRQKMVSTDIRLSDDIISFIASHIKTNIRRLEGAFVSVSSYASLMKKPLSVGEVERLLRGTLMEEAKKSLTIETIQKCVAEHYDIRVADMTSRRRPANLAFPRQVAMFLARSLTAASLNEIGEAFGGKDHGTVLHAYRLIERRMKEDQGLRQKVAYLQQQLQR